MKDYLNLRLSDEQMKTTGTLGLAYVGDAVYELLVRAWLCERGSAAPVNLHREAVRYVSAPAQAAAAAQIMEKLSAEELALFKRGRNAKVNTVPKSADTADYHAATGLEALFGWLYMKGETERINEIFEYIAEG